MLLARNLTPRNTGPITSHYGTDQVAAPSASDFCVLPEISEAFAERVWTSSFTLFPNWGSRLALNHLRATAEMRLLGKRNTTSQHEVLTFLDTVRDTDSTILKHETIQCRAGLLWILNDSRVVSVRQINRNTG